MQHRKRRLGRAHTDSAFRGGSRIFRNRSCSDFSRSGRSNGCFRCFGLCRRCLGRFCDLGLFCRLRSLSGLSRVSLDHLLGWLHFSSGRSCRSLFSDRLSFGSGLCCSRFSSVSRGCRRLFLSHSKSYGHQSHCNRFLQIHTILLNTVFCNYNLKTCQKQVFFYKSGFFSATYRRFQGQ